MTGVSEKISRSMTAARKAVGSWSDWVGRTPEQRFWSKVSFPRGGVDGCWLWTGGTNEHGYGVFSSRGGPMKAHRWSLERSLGRPLSGHALHSCDTPACVNPSHLREGSQAENIHDAMTRGRFSPPPRHEMRGATHPSSKLTAEQVAEIRRAPPGKNGAKKALAEKLGVSQATVSMIWHGKRRASS